MGDQVFYKDNRKNNYNGNLRDVSNICTTKTVDNTGSHNSHVKYPCHFNNSGNIQDLDVEQERAENHAQMSIEASDRNSTMDDRKKTQKIGMYLIEKTIGKGNFSVVKLATHTITQMKVAIKIIDKSRLNDENMKKMYREVDIMKQLCHPSIVKMYQVMETPKILYIVMEYVPKGEVFEHIATHGRFSEEEARSKFSQILNAVEHCHTNLVVHRDLKAENLLLDAQMNIKLADFGFGTFFSPSANGNGSINLSTWCGSPPYAAPEIFKGEQYQGPKADVWSLGVVLYVLVCGALPFDEQTLPRLRDQVLVGRYRIPYWMSDACEELIRNMLNRNPAKRPSISKIQQHKWFTQTASDKSKDQPQSIDNNDPQGNVILGSDDQNKATPEYNETAIQLMEKKGMKRHQIMESLEGKSYDHLTAFYLLLNERLKLHRPSVIQENISHQSGHHTQKVSYEQVMRRPSSVAEHALLQCPHNVHQTNQYTDQHQFNHGESVPLPHEQTAPPPSNQGRDAPHSSCSSSLSSTIAMQNQRQLSPHSFSAASNSNSPRPILGAGPPDASVSSGEDRKSPPLSLLSTNKVVSHLSDTDNGLASGSPFHIRNSGSPETLLQVLQNLQIKELNKAGFTYPLVSEDSSYSRNANLPPTAGNFHCNSIDEGVVVDKTSSWLTFPHDPNISACSYSTSRRHTIGAEDVAQPYTVASPVYNTIYPNNSYQYYMQRNSTGGHYQQHQHRQNRVVSSARVQPELLITNHPFIHQQHTVTSSPIVMQAQAAAPTRGISLDSGASITSFDSGTSANKAAHTDNSNLKDLMVNILPRSSYSPSSSPEPSSQSKMMKIAPEEENSPSRQLILNTSGPSNSGSYGYGATLPLHHQISLGMTTPQEPLQRLHSTSSDSSKPFRGPFLPHQRPQHPQVVPPLPIQYNDGRRASECIERAKVKPASTSKALFGTAKVGGAGTGQMPHANHHPQTGGFRGEQADSNYGYASVAFQKSLRDTGRTGGLLEIVTTRASSPLKTYSLEGGEDPMSTPHNLATTSRGYNTLYSSQRRATMGPATASVPQPVGLQHYLQLQQQQQQNLSSSPREEVNLGATVTSSSNDYSPWSVPFDSSTSPSVGDSSTFSNGTPVIGANVSNNQHTLQLQNLTQVPLHYHSATKRMSLPTSQPIITNQGNHPEMCTANTNPTGGASPSLRLFSNSRVIRGGGGGTSAHHSPCSRSTGAHYQRQHGIYRPLNTITNDNEQIMEERVLAPSLSVSREQSPGDAAGAPPDSGILINQMTTPSATCPNTNNPLWPASSYS